MELSVLDACGLPEGSILSVRSGPTRRQSPMPCSAPFKLPAGPWPLRIDVLALLGKSKQGASLGKLDADGCCRVPLDARDGRPMSVTLQVFDGKNGAARPRTAPNLNRNELDEPEEEAAPNSPVRRRDTEAEARAYLDHHRLHEFMHSLFELLLRERPTDPYGFIAVRFREAALLEPRCPGRPEPISKLALQKPATPIPPSMPRPQPSTVPREALDTPIPAGSLQVTVKNLRGRTMARLIVQRSEKIIEIKRKIEAMIGVPANSQHLLWWAETLPNDTSFEEDFVTDTYVTVHLAFGTRDPRFKNSVSGSGDGGLRLWNLENGELVQDLLVPGAEKGTESYSSGVLLAVEAHWDSMRAVSGALNGNLQLWDLHVGGRGCLGVMEGHTAEVGCLVVKWDTMQAMSGSADGSARLWDLNALKCLKVFAGSHTIWNIAVDWSNQRLCCGNRTGAVVLWNMETGQSLLTLDTAKAAAESATTSVASVSIDAVRNRALSGLEDGHLVYWHYNDPTSEMVAAPPPTKVLLAHYSAVRAMSLKWADLDSRALCGSDDGSLSLWRLDTQECIVRFSRHVGFVWTVYADWSRGRALSGAFDGCVKLWDLRSGDCLRTIQSHIRPVRCIHGG